MSFIRNILRTREKSQLEEQLAGDYAPAIIVRLAKIYQEDGDLAKARQVARRGAEKFPEDQEVCNLERELVRVDREAEIKRLWEQVEQYPNARVFSHLADLLRAAGDPGEARRVVAMGLRNYADHGGLHYVQGLLDADEGKTEEACGHLARAAELDRQNYGALRALGEALSSLGRHAEAAEAYGRILEFAQGDAEVLELCDRALASGGGNASPRSAAEQPAVAEVAAPPVAKSAGPSADTRILPVEEMIGDISVGLREMVAGGGMEGAVLADGRGLPVASALPEGLDETLAAAVAMELRRAGSPVCGESGLGAMEQLVLEATGGAIYVYALRELTLAVLPAQGAKAGMVDMRVRAFAAKALGQR
jgi:predicted regulator of Ras-like GTPase activity (Roadblock/LC7/MglB family)